MREIFETHQGRAVLKWDHYFDIYHRHFAPYRGKDVVLLEIGVYQGGSLALWKNYFGDSLRLFGVDIHPGCKEFEDDQTTIYIGSQSDPDFLRHIKDNMPRPDIIIDDGGHMMHQQITSLKELFSHLKDGGLYVVEDLHTSYWKEYDGGYRRKQTFIEYSKDLIDQLHAYHSRTSALQPDAFTASIRGLHFYDSVLVIEKGDHPAPEPVERGETVIDRREFSSGKKTGLQRLKKYLSDWKKRKSFLGTASPWSLPRTTGQQGNGVTG